MPWRRGHYYRSVRVNGRPKRDHIGTGLMAPLIAQQDDAAWEARGAAKLAEDLRRARADAVDQLVEEADSHLDALARAPTGRSGWTRPTAVTCRRSRRWPRSGSWRSRCELAR